MPRPKKRGGAAAGRGRGRGGRGSKRGATSAPSISPTVNNSAFFRDEDFMLGSSYENVGQEVIIDGDIDVDISCSNSPANSFMNEMSNENSVSSFGAAESHSKSYTRIQDLTLPEVLPDNFFTEADEDMLDPLILDPSMTLNDGPGFSLNNLFPIKEEVCETELKNPENIEENLKKSSRRRVKQENITTADIPKLQMISLYEEKLLYRKLRQLSERKQLKPEHNRLYRKLSLRNTKRSIGVEPFNFDYTVAKLADQEWTCQKNDDVSIVSVANVLDRFQKGCFISAQFSSSRNNGSFRTRLFGSGDQLPQPFVSPYTGRTLTPFIRRDYETRPLKLKILEEIRKKCSDDEIRNLAMKPIDYCYVQPHHIPAINSICKDFFWDGIDVTECLEYPDFSCVVLYGHLIIGFAFMVPDVSYNEAYISYIFTHPEWRGSGIAKFMLYHLIMSCRGTDVTLHVSKTNPALNLYHKFGFKVQEFVADFYDKYYPADSNECKHAFFMRLTR